MGRWVLVPAPRAVFCARIFVPSESPLVFDAGSTRATSGQVGLWCLPCGSYARICICIWICVLVPRVLSLISFRSTCFCLSAEQLDIAVPDRDDAGSRYALLRLVELFFIVPEPAKPYGYTFLITRELCFLD